MFTIDVYYRCLLSSENIGFLRVGCGEQKAWIDFMLSGRCTSIVPKTQFFILDQMVMGIAAECGFDAASQAATHCFVVSN